MKRLLIALVAAVAVSTGFAKLTITQGFETDTDGFAIGQDGDSSTVELHGDVPNMAVPYNFTGFEQKYLSLDTGDATLWRTNTDEAAYFDMVMQFNPSATPPEPDAGTKLAVYVNASTNLVVISGNGSGGTSIHESAKTLSPGQWARLTIAANGGKFFVRINGDLVNNDGYYPLTGDDTATIESVGFKGSGALDDFVARTTDPFFDYEHETYAANIGGAGAEYYANYSDALADALAASTPATITLADGTTTMNGSSTNAYQIATADDLVALADAVDANAAVRSLNFVQTANIDMAKASAFAGIGTYNANPTAGTPFTGTYDGQGYKISNVTMTARNYGGIFNQVNGGTIKNLTVENMSFPADATGEYGFGIVGNVGGDGALLQNLVAAGSFGSAEKPGTHNMAGIVVRGCGGGTNGALVQNCTNNAAIYGNYTKLAGICAITQNKIEGAAITFDGCANNGALNLSRTSTGVTGLAGIVGYVNDDTVLVGCSNTGSLNNTVQGANTDCNGLLVGWAYDHVLTDNGNNSASSAAKMLAKQSPASFKDGSNKDHTCTVTGFQYATVDNGVATTIAPPYTLAKDTTYLLEGNVAASETPVYTFDSAGTIAFNTALGYTFAGTVAVDNPNMLDVDDGKPSGNVTTYTATGGTAVAQITKGEPATTTQYNTLAKALIAATLGDTVVLLADNTAAFSIPAGVTVDCSTFVNTGMIGGSGTIKVNASPAANLPTFANDWVGTYQVAWNPDSSNARINFNDLGNANSKVEIVGVDGQFIVLPSTNWGTSGGSTPTIQPELVITASWTINNGWDTVTTINKLSGTGELIVNGSGQGTAAIPYTINTIDGFSGTLKGTRSQYTLGNIVYANPTFGDCLVKIGSVFAPTLGSTTLNGSAANLCFDTLNAQKGVYMVAAAATVEGVTTPYASVANAIDAVGTPTGNTSVPTVVVYDSSSAVYPGWTLNGDTYTYAGAARAKIGTTEYQTLTLALTAAGTEVATEIELVGACSESVTIPANVTVAVDNGIAFNGTVAGAGTIVYTAAPSGTLAFGDWTGTVNLNYANIVSTADFAAVANARGIAGSWVEIGKNGTAIGYMNSDLNPSLKVTGLMTINNGSSSTKRSIGTVSGAGTLVFVSANAGWGETCNYSIAQLDGWNGVITNGSSAVVIDAINSGAGTVLYKNKPATAPTIGSGWEGTFVADWAGANNMQFDINAYGNENSVVEVTKLAGGYVSGSNADVTVVPTVNVSGSMLLDNGYSGKITTFTKLTGSGAFSNTTYTVNVTTLDNFTGTLTPLDSFGMFISTISLDAVPESGSKVVALGTGARIRAIASTKVSVGGVVQDIELEVIEGSEGYGIYVKDNTVYVAQIGADGEKYVSLRAAIEAATAGATINLLCDDSVSFAADNLEIGINKALTIDGNGYTVYGVSDYAGGAGDHDIYISGSGDVTIKNVTLAGFAGSVANNMRTYPIWTGSAYSGTLTLDTVTVQDFNRTAFNLNGGTVVVTNCTITCDTTKATDFQEGIGVYLANVTIVDTTITGAGSTREDWSKAACIQLGNPNGTVPGTGTITVLGGSFAGQYGIIVASNAQNNVTVQGGSFTGSLEVEEGEAGTISITGGTFSVDPSDYVASGYEAKESAGVWTVSVKSSEPVTPGEDDGESYDSAEDAAAAAAEVEVGATAAVETAVGAAGLDAYLANFEGKVVENGDGTYKVVVGLKAEAEAALADDATTNVMATVAASLPDIVADAATEQTEVTVSNVVPGFYYSISYGTALGAMNTEGARVLAPASGTIKLQTPAKAADATAGFYKVNVNVTDK